METVLALLVGILFGSGVYLMLSRNLVQFLLGLVLISNAANVMIFAAGGLTRGRPAIVPGGLEQPAGAIANPLPQALILTAIVIGFGLLAFALVLACRACQELGTVDTDRMRVAEPEPKVEDEDASAPPPVAARRDAA